MEGNARRAGLVLAALIGLMLVAGQSRPVTAARSGRSTACIFDHLSLRTAKGTCRPRARAYPASVSGTVRHSIYDAALTFGVPYGVLLKIARCESHLDPRATYAGHYGLYQFLPETFFRGAGGMHTETGINAHSYWNALDASYVAGYMFVTGRSTSWSCMHIPGT